MVFLTQGTSDGLGKPESFMDLKFVEKIKNYIAVGANITDNFDQKNFDKLLSDFRDKQKNDYSAMNEPIKSMGK